MHPSSMVLTLTGAGLLWFGWFGFNGGSALASNAIAVSAFTATQVAAAAAALTWMTVEWLHKGKPTVLGLATGLVVGLAAVTPASGFVYMWGGLIIGVIASLVCYVAVCLKPVFKYDDSLDAFGVHGVSGFLGAVLTGVLCYGTVNGNGACGLLATGKWTQVVSQFVAACTAAALAFVGSLVLVKVVDMMFGFVTDARSETEGLDRTEHGETGFDYGLTLEAVPERGAHEPRPAHVPPDGHRRFTVVVEGADDDKLINTWSELCQVGRCRPRLNSAVFTPS